MHGPDERGIVPGEVYGMVGTICPEVHVISWYGKQKSMAFAGQRSL